MCEGFDVASLRDLRREGRQAAKKLLLLGRRVDRSLAVTSVYRSRASQERLYARFLAGKSGGIPVAPPGRSKHFLRRAFDFARPGVDPFEDELLERLGEIWLDAGGRWFPSDPVHFEF